METLTFDKYTGELVKKNSIQPKIINKAHRLLEDLKIPQWGCENTMFKWIEEGVSKRVSKKKWREMIDSLYDTIAYKGDLFFRSKLFRDKEGVYYLYNNNISTEITEPRDVLFGKAFPVAIEYNRYKHWENHLYRNAYIFSRGKFEEVETEELSFEQTHIVELLNNDKKGIENKIDEQVSNIYNINETINHLNYAK